MFTSVCVGSHGRLMFSTSFSECLRESNSAYAVCVRWYDAQPSLHASRQALLTSHPDAVPACPCMWWQAVLDPRFLEDPHTGCVVTVFLTASTMAQVCTSVDLAMVVTYD